MSEKAPDRSVPLLRKLFRLALDYWSIYNREIKQRAVVWVRNDETGELLIYTRGEHAEELAQFIASLDSKESAS